MHNLQRLFQTENYCKNNIITGPKEIAENFNKCFTEIGPSLARKIPPPNKSFYNFLKETNTVLDSEPLSTNELKEAFFSLKINKSPGIDGITFNVTKKCFGELHDVLRFLFDLSLKTGIFPDPLKIAKVTPLFKTGETSELSNYRPISVLPCFSKILERIMYNRLYKYLVNEKILYSKQFGLQNCHSTKHAITQLVDQVYDAFENN